MFAVIVGIHVLICLGLIVVVLLQTGRGTGMASVFGGGGGGSVMGGKGFGGVLAKATGALAILFMITSITLTLIPRGGGQRSVLERRAAEPAREAPAGQTQPVESGELPSETPAEAPLETSPETPAETPADVPAGE
jgi:preprotein translocase subunit SecG